MKNFEFSVTSLISLVVKKWRTIVFLNIITLLVSSYVSLYLIEPKFKSSVVIFPTTTSSVSQALLIEHNPYRKDVLEFGEEEGVEQLLQILNSDAIRDSIVKIFKLYEHYGIDKDSDYSTTKVYKTYNDLVSFKKTKFNSIEISVLDKSPLVAADMANEFLKLIDSTLQRIRKNRALQSLNILENRKNLLYKKRNEIQDSLMFYRNNGIISITPQVERLTEQYAIALSQNNITGAKRIKSELNNFAKFAGPHDMLLRKSYVVEEELALIESESEKLSVDAKYSLDNKFTINKAFPADKKTSPVRWLVVFCSVVSVSIFYIFLTSFLYLIDEFKYESEQE